MSYSSSPTVSTSCRVPHYIQGTMMSLRKEPLQWAFTCLLLTALSSAADLIQDSLLHWANWLWWLQVFPCFSWLIKNSGELLGNSSWSCIPRCLELGDVPLGGTPQGLLSAPLWKYGVCLCACVYYAIPIGPLSNTINEYLREYVVHTGKTLIFLELPPTAYLIWSMDIFLEHLSICAHGVMIVVLLICTYGRVYMYSIPSLLQLINSLIPFLRQIFSQSWECSHYSLPPF